MKTRFTNFFASGFTPKHLISHLSYLISLSAVVAMGVAGPALAGTTIGYSGQLRNEKGEALTQLNQQITFTLYAEPNGGVALWSAMRNVVLSQEGYFNVELEDDTDVTTSLEEVLQKNSTLYIGLKPKGAAAEIAPRQRILATPHAAVATAAKTGVDGFEISGTATVTTLAATTVKAGAVQQQYTNGTKVAYGDLLPKGVIVMWNGEADKVPAGWALCNGENGTPDLRGRFVVGYDPNDKDYSTVGNMGGEKTHKLTTDEMPKHKHTTTHTSANEEAGWKDGSCLLTVSDNRGGDVDRVTDYQGGDQAHENRPPYFALCYIMKL